MMYFIIKVPVCCYQILYGVLCCTLVLLSNSDLANQMPPLQLSAGQLLERTICLRIIKKKFSTYFFTKVEKTI